MFSLHIERLLKQENLQLVLEEMALELLLLQHGKAAHLAGAIAANTSLPVIGIPIKSSTLDGLDALLSTVQMPSGIPVATVAIDGAQNAELLGIQILALEDNDLSEKLEEEREKNKRKVLELDEEISKKY